MTSSRWTTFGVRDRRVRNTQKSVCMGGGSPLTKSTAVSVARARKSALSGALMTICRARAATASQDAGQTLHHHTRRRRFLPSSQPKRPKACLSAVALQQAPLPTAVPVGMHCQWPESWTLKQCLLQRAHRSMVDTNSRASALAVSASFVGAAVGVLHDSPAPPLPGVPTASSAGVTRRSTSEAVSSEAPCLGATSASSAA